MSFKVGDKVKCVNNRGREKCLTEGKNYEVSRQDDNLTVVLNDRGKEDGFFSHRFQLIELEKEQSENPECSEYSAVTDRLGKIEKLLNELVAKLEE